MITEITTPFIENKESFISWLKEQRWPDYTALLSEALKASYDPDRYSGQPDPDRIHAIDDGDYQGTLVLVVAEGGYQPSTYWVTKVSYGSCSGCDALQDAWGYSDDHNYEALYSITLHMLQGMVKV